MQHSFSSSPAYPGCEYVQQQEKKRTDLYAMVLEGVREYFPDYSPTAAPKAGDVTLHNTLLLAHSRLLTLVNGSLAQEDAMLRIQDRVSHECEEILRKQTKREERTRKRLQTAVASGV